MVIVDRHVLDACIAQRRHHGRFPHAFGQPRALRTLAQLLVQVIGKFVDLADPVSRRNRSQHGFGISSAEEFRLPALDHILEQLHVLRVMLEHVVEQPAAQVNCEMKIRVAMQHLQKGAIAPEMCIVEDVREIADRLVRMDPKQQCD